MFASRVAPSAVLLFVAACDRQKGEPLPVVRPEPPRPAVLAAGPLPAASSALAAPPAHSGTGIAKAVPPGIVEGVWEAGGKCNLEGIDGSAFAGKPLGLKGGLRAKITGWALDSQGAGAPDSVHLRFSSPDSGEYYCTAAERTVRDDVNSVHHVRSKTALSGFEATLDSDQLPEGTYGVTTVMRFGERTLICDNGRKVKRTR